MRIFIAMILAGCGLAHGQVKNYRLDVGGPGKYVCEPSIAVNPRNPKNIVAASVLDNVYYTFDGGQTWQKINVKSPLGVYGDPVLVADRKGNFYFFHLSDPTGEGWENEKSLEHIVCHVSQDGGKTWDAGNSIGYNPPKDQDKPWAFVDAKGNIYVSWTEFDKYASTDSTCQSRILLSTSSNGKKWSSPTLISNIPGDCIDDDNTAEGAVPAATDDKKIFVAWSNRDRIFFDRSFDNGKTWLTNDIVVAAQPGGWAFNVPGHDRCNGMPVLQLDQTNSNHKGVLYITWGDQRDGVSNSDVWFSRSINFGDSWTPPVKISDDKENRHQYLPWMAVDQGTGIVYILYYDRKNYPDNRTDVYIAYSDDLGETFKEVQISETPFIPTDNAFFGDYTNVSAHNGTIAAIWTRMEDGITSVVTAVFSHDELAAKVKQ